jgi:integrase
MAVRLIAPRLVLFFALLYFAGLRPEEAVEVRREDFDIPKPTLNESTGEWEYGDGEIHLRAATPDVAGEWTDSGERGEKRDQLKHRERGQGRVSPCPAELSRIVYEHVAAYGLAPDGRLVRGQRDDRRLSSSVYQRVWQRAREATFVPEVVESPLAKRPYDLRHAFVSSALNATGDPVRVAEWAGHSVAVLLRVYAKCIAGGERSARTKLAAWLTGQ